MKPLPFAKPLGDVGLGTECAIEMEKLKMRTVFDVII